MNHLHARWTWIGLGICGLVPALVILGAFRLADGQLIVAGQASMEYDLARLVAAQVSIMMPITLLLPLALGLDIEAKALAPQAFAGPLLLFGPGLLAGVLIGGSGLAQPLIALLLLAGLVFSLYLWVLLLTRLLGPRLAVLTYAGFWAASKYVEYLRLYVLPDAESAGLQAVGYLNWLLPQVESGPSLIDDYLQAGTLSWQGLGPSAIQAGLLLALLSFLARKAETSGR